MIVQLYYVFLNYAVYIFVDIILFFIHCLSYILCELLLNKCGHCHYKSVLPYFFMAMDTWVNHDDV